MTGVQTHSLTKANNLARGVGGGARGVGGGARGVGGGARGVVVIAVGNEHGDTSSNPVRN